MTDSSHALLLCPHCQGLCMEWDRQCAQCHRNLGWLLQAPRLRAALLEAGQVRFSPVDVPPLPIERFPPHACGSLGEISLPTSLSSTMPMGKQTGAVNGNAITLPDPGVDMVHSVVLWEGAMQEYWIADNQSQTGTFVNGRPIVAQSLHSGDLIQIGPYAWTFNERDRLFLRVGPVNGLTLEFRDVGIAGRLRNFSCGIHPGEFVAVVGPSGAGKSTLIRALIDDPALRFRGQMLADGWDIRDQADWFRAQLGYVSQNDALHADLTAEQMVTFAARLRDAPIEPVRHVLKEVDFPNLRHGGFCQDLSGGESKRLRLAAELIAQPRLLVLDEPGSGLDEGRETGMMRLIRQQARRGGTILMITHNLRLMQEYCDRVLVVVAGELVFDGTPTELLNRMPSGDFRDLKDAIASAAAAAPPICLPEASAFSPMTPPGRSLATGVFTQFRQVVYRELVRLCNLPCALSLLLDSSQTAERESRLRAWFQTTFRRLLLPLVVLPLLFAAAIGFSVPPTDRALLGFLSLLACIWMGASLSLMSIVDEREAYNHERLLFLRIVPYISAKMAVLSLLATGQCLVFAMMLLFLRTEKFTGRSDAMFYGTGSAIGVLILVSLAATGLGLAISALANRSRPTANFLLPLVMMAQIVFSVQVAAKGEDDLQSAYRNFRFRREQVIEENRYDPRPSRVAAIASFFTFSRYGDIALRSFAYQQSTYEAFRGAHVDTSPVPFDSQRESRQWRSGAFAVLSVAVVALPALAATVLWFQEQRGPIIAVIRFRKLP